MGWMMFFWVVLIVGVPTVLWFLLFEQRRENDARGDSPETILTQQYERGEIDREDYERRLSIIGGRRRRG